LLLCGAAFATGWYRGQRSRAWLKIWLVAFGLLWPGAAAGVW